MNMKTESKYICKQNNGCFNLNIYHSGKTNYYGTFKTIEEAILVRNKTLKEIGHNNTSKAYNPYVNNIEMYKELIICKSTGILSDKLFKMCYKIVKGVSKKFYYKFEDDRFDCEAYAIEVFIKNWLSFDELRYNNAFAYFSEIIKRAFAMQYKILQKSRLNTISFDLTDEEGNRIVNI